MLRLLNPHVGPVGGIRFVDPDTHYEYNNLYRTVEELEAHVRQHRDQNKLPPIEDFRQVWEHWICGEHGMEKACCPVTANIERTFEQYISGAKAYVRRMLSSTGFVGRVEADRRASLCIDCNQNLVNIGHSHSKFYSDRFMASQVGNEKTSFDNKLYTCKICTCLLRSKVHYPAKEVAVSLSDAEIGKLSRTPRHISNGQPLRCWQLDALEESKK